MDKRLRLILSVIIFVGMQSLLLAGSLVKIAPGTPGARFLSGYEVHFAAFFATAFAASIILSHEFVNFRYPFLGAFLYSVVASVLVEYLQKYLTTYRMYDLKDMAAGMAGALAYVVLAKIVVFFFTARGKSPGA